jgi:iron(III) transport system ATP-binding protein
VLLDEPLSNLDARLRESMRFELKRLQRETGVTMVYVTHDQNEALALSDVVTVMSAGNIVQSGPPEEIYDQPNSLFVAQFVGSPNLVPGVVGQVAGGSARITTEVGQITVENCAQTSGARIRVLMRPEDFTITAASETTDSGAGNSFEGVITATAFEGEKVRHHVKVGDLTFECHSERHRALADGTGVRLVIPASRVRLVPEDDVAETAGAPGMRTATGEAELAATA